MTSPQHPFELKKKTKLPLIIGAIVVIAVIAGLALFKQNASHQAFAENNVLKVHY